MIAIGLLWRRQNEQKAEIESLHLELNALSLRDEHRREQAGSSERAPETDATETERRAWMAQASLDERIARTPAEPIGDEPQEASPGLDPQTAAAIERTVETAEPLDTGDAGSKRPALQFDFEDIFGRRLPIWAGGIALAIAGIFLVRFSIEAGLLTPPVRVAASFIFGFLLLACAEAALHFEARIADPRVRQALAGAGLATLYAAFYLAGTRYGLIGASTAFVGLAAVTAGAIGLAFRYGLPTALLGLVGGFAAPALVASDEANVPVLTIYLALVAAGLAWTGARIGKPWLGLVALAGGFGWGAVLMAAELVAEADLAAVGLLLVVLGVVVPILVGRETDWRWPRIGAAAVASLQMAMLIDLAGYDLLTWGLYLLLAAALAVLGWREAFLREAGAFAAALGLCLLALWDPPSLSAYAGIAALFAMVFIGSPLALLMRDRAREIDLWQIGAVTVALAFVNRTQWDLWREVPVMLRALPDLLLAIAPALALQRIWRKRPTWHEEFGLLAGAALLVTLANWVLAPAWAAPLAVAPVALALAWFADRRDEIPFTWLGFMFAALGVCALFVGEGFVDELGGALGLEGPANAVQAAVRWLAVAIPFAALAVIARPREWRVGGEVAATIAFYGAAAQLLPDTVIPAALALALAGLAWRMPRRDGALATAAALLLAWAALPVARWLFDILSAVAVGGPVLLDALPPPVVVWERFAPLVLGAIAVLRLHPSIERNLRLAIASLAVTVGVIGAHILYKQLFAIDSPAMFAARGMAERTIWQAILLGSGMALLARARANWLKPLGLVFSALAAAHVALFSLVLHNPVWSAQSVGAMPIANLLLAAYAVAIAAAVVLRRRLASITARATAWVDAAIMALLVLYTLSELRHAFSGSDLTAAPLGQAEDFLRSVLGIVLAIGFLLWGRRTAQRHWRVGSLVLMLVAVGKVFLLDAAGLEGLLRVASFLALGISLIAIGWLYSRQLAPARSVASG